MDKVIVEDRIDGTMRIRHGKLLLPFHEIDALPQKPTTHAPVKPKKTYRPPADHPWKKAWSSKKASNGKWGLKSNNDLQVHSGDEIQE